jgi:serine/threonine protein kinase
MLSRDRKNEVNLHNAFFIISGTLALKTRITQILKIKQFKPPQFSATTARDLISKLVVFDPEQRLSAREALNHAYVCVYQLPQEVDQVQISVPEELAMEATADLLYGWCFKKDKEFENS